MLTVVGGRKRCGRDMYIPRSILPLYGLALNMPDGGSVLLARGLCHDEVERKKKLIKQAIFTRYQL